MSYQQKNKHEAGEAVSAGKNVVAEGNVTAERERIAVVGIDYPCMDYIVEVERLPGTNDEVDIDNESWQGGGMVPTALVALGRLGVRSGLIGVVGTDIYGTYCVEDLKRHNVDVSRIVTDEGQTTDFCISVAERSTKGRSFITRWGSVRRLVESDLDEEYIAGAKYLHLCMEMNEINVAAARIAKKSDVKVVIDADHYSELTEQHLDLIDVFIASEKYYRKKFEGDVPDVGAADVSAGDAAENAREGTLKAESWLASAKEHCCQVLEKGPSVVVFTLGDKGCIGMSKEGFFHLDAFNPGTIVDTTGAGDVFHGAFIRAMLDGKSIKECARFASAVSVIKCLRLGGRAGIPNLETTQEFLRTGVVGSCDFEERERYYRSGLDTIIHGRSGGEL